MAIGVLSGCPTIEQLVLGGPSANTAGGAGDLSTVQVGNNKTVQLEAGTYRGELLVAANNAEIAGAGIGETTIRGDVMIDGNSNRIIGVTIIGTVSIDGNSNDLTLSDVSQADVRVDGNNNTY
jgi:formylmethanofuran dehydrogenase subunit C